MSEHEAADAPTDRCPHCGTELAVATVDFADTPDVSEDLDHEKAMVNPGQMAQTTYCPNPECPGPAADSGAEL